MLEAYYRICIFGIMLELNFYETAHRETKDQLEELSMRMDGISEKM